MPEQVKAKKPRSGTVSHTVHCADGGYIELFMTRKLAMACMCMECIGWEGNPADCTSIYCPLYPFRAATRRTAKGTK